MDGAGDGVPDVPHLLEGVADDQEPDVGCHQHFLRRPTGIFVFRISFVQMPFASANLQCDVDIVLLLTADGVAADLTVLDFS